MLQTDPPLRRPASHHHYGSAVDAPSAAHHAAPSSPPPSSSARIVHLDGLRAVALLGVLSFHFRLGPFSGGGFVGVDMFFTLSGYLITRNLLRDITSSSHFSLRRFYERRFFRLFPAAVVTLLVTLLVTASIFTKELSIIVYTRAVATLLLLSNVFSHWHRGYFDISADDSPLLHYWSLSVEEQFYLLWPPFLLLLRKRVRARMERERQWELESNVNGMDVTVVVEEEGSSLKSDEKTAQGSSSPSELDMQLRSAALQAIAILSVLSLAFAATVYFPHSSWAFYELPSRVFQFGVGAMLSAATPAYDNLLSLFEGSSPSSSPQPTKPLLLPHALTAPAAQNNNTNNLLAEFVSTCAFIVLVASLVLVPSNPWPVLVLPMTLATGILIIARHTFVARVILSHPILLFIGRISYSVYLVHWPLYVLGTHFQCALGRVNAFNLPYARAFLFAASFPLGIFLYRTVETKFRHIYGTSSSSILSVSVNASDNSNMEQQKLQQQKQQKGYGDGCKRRRRRTVYALSLTSFVFAVTGVVTGGLPQLFPGQSLTGFPPEATGAAPARTITSITTTPSSTFITNNDPFTNHENPFTNAGHIYHERVLREQFNLHPQHEQQHPPQSARALTTDGVCFSVTDKYKPHFTEVFVCRYGATNIPGKQPDMYAFGDSFASMLAVALHVIGQRRNMLFQVHFALNCGLRAKGYELVALGVATGYDCVSATGVLWSHMNMLPSNATIVVSNLWHRYGDELVDELGKLRADIESNNPDSDNGVRMMSSMALSQSAAPYRTGRTMKLISEPPGVHDRYNWVYRCESLWGLPLGRALAWVTRTPFRGGAYCLSEADRVALPPKPDMLRKHPAIQTAKRTCLRNNTVVDLVSELCMGLDDADTKAVRCRLPIAQTKVMWDVGYKFDLNHISAAGAFNVAGLLEQQLL